MATATTAAPRERLSLGTKLLYGTGDWGMASLQHAAPDLLCHLSHRRGGGTARDDPQFSDRIRTLLARRQNRKVRLAVY